ncbi:MAG: AraC family transcriptional regulator [Lachnospiraceae bacterium]|nr:AraC family transcriptional regulator [Lachnospiraceae bacterium]
MSIQNDLAYQEFTQRESGFVRAPYNPELEFYAKIKSGDMEAVKEHCNSHPFVLEDGWGRLSKNRLQNMKYHFTITAAMLARYCIEGGLELSVSYALSDFYVQKVDEVTKESDITAMHFLMCLDYTKRMKNMRKKKIQSRPVAQCIDYIYDHLHTRITVTDLAKLTKLNPNYLSRIFKKETGVSISSYIRSQKLITAQNMLIYSDYSPAEIAQILAFPSQSYFTEIFHKIVGVTPLKYRNQNLHSTQIGHSMGEPV